MTTTYIISGIVLILLFFVIIAYNSLIKKKNNCQESWSGIAIQLKRRYDLIPNLVSTVKGYAKHESTVFEKVTKARSEAMNSKSMAEKAKNENALTETLKSLFAVSENYPDLKANQNFLHLQEELTDTEDKIQSSRKFYNNTVRSLNTSIESIPTNIIAKMFNFEKREFFEIEGEEKEKAKNPVETNF
jgi:LemA protein